MKRILFASLTLIAVCGLLFGLYYKTSTSRPAVTCCKGGSEDQFGDILRCNC